MRRDVAMGSLTLFALPSGAAVCEPGTHQFTLQDKWILGLGYRLSDLEIQQEDRYWRNTSRPGEKYPQTRGSSYWSWAQRRGPGTDTKAGDLPLRVFLIIHSQAPKPPWWKFFPQLPPVSPAASASLPQVLGPTWRAFGPASPQVTLSFCC